MINLSMQNYMYHFVPINDALFNEVGQFGQTGNFWWANRLFPYRKCRFSSGNYMETWNYHKQWLYGPWKLHDDFIETSHKYAEMLIQDIFPEMGTKRRGK